MIEHITTEQIWQNEQTRYWFNVDGTEYCVCDQNGEYSLLDSEGFPIEEGVSAEYELLDVLIDQPEVGALTF